LFGIRLELSPVPKPTYLGHYIDEFTRENGVWKFLRRQSVSDLSPLRP
jgi:hypothetical protein